MSDTADRIAKILEDPESVKMISEIAESFMGNATLPPIGDKESTGEEEKNENRENRTENTSAEQFNIPSTMVEAMNKLMSGGDIDNTVRLIAALKPYLRKHRRDSAESVLKMLNIMKTFGNSNVTEMLKLLGAAGSHAKE